MSSSSRWGLVLRHTWNSASLRQLPEIPSCDSRYHCGDSVFGGRLESWCIFRSKAQKCSSFTTSPGSFHLQWSLLQFIRSLLTKVAQAISMEYLLRWKLPKCHNTSLSKEKCWLKQACVTNWQKDMWDNAWVFWVFFFLSWDWVILSDP